MEGFMTDFSTSGDNGVSSTYHLNPGAPGQVHRVGGSFPGIDSPYNLQPNNGDGRPADMNTVWGIQSQSSRMGSGLV